MSIKGLTTDREPAFPRIGILRKGSEKQKKDGKEIYGKDLTYFRFDTDDRQAEIDFAAAYASKDGKVEPASINVYLPFPTPDENFQAWQEEYKAGGLVHRCDGETMTVWLGPDGKYQSTPKPCPYHTGEKTRTTKEPGCKAIGRLTVIVPELRRFAYVTALTNSKNDIMELTDNLNAVYAMRGTLQGIPFRLMRRPRMISTPTADGGRARYEKWMLSLEVNPDWAQLQLESMRKQAMLPTGVKLLTTGQVVDNETGEIIEDFSLDDVDEIPFDEEAEEGKSSQATGTVAEPPVATLSAAQLRKLQAQFTATFNGLNVDDARHWYIEKWTAKHTPDNVRKSASLVTDDEADTMIAELKKYTSGLRNTFQTLTKPAETVPA